MCSLRPSLGRDGVARGHVLDLGRDLVGAKRKVLARVGHVRGLGDGFFEGRGVLVLDDGVLRGTDAVAEQPRAARRRRRGDRVK